MGILLQNDRWSAELRSALPALIPLGLVGTMLVLYLLPFRKQVA